MKENRDISSLSEDEKKLYLEGLFLLGISDGHFDDREKSFLDTLSNCGTDFEIKFEKRSDFDPMFMEALFKFLKADEVKFSFLRDCISLMRSDGEIHNNEKCLLSTYMDLLDLTSEEKSDYISKLTNNII